MPPISQKNGLKKEKKQYIGPHTRPRTSRKMHRALSHGHVERQAMSSSMAPCPGGPARSVILLQKHSPSTADPPNKDEQRGAAATTGGGERAPGRRPRLGEPKFTVLYFS
jgi:hypothetical protein